MVIFYIYVERKCCLENVVGMIFGYFFMIKNLFFVCNNEINGVIFRMMEFDYGLVKWLFIYVMIVVNGSF